MSERPDAGTWVIDPAHTTAGFVARHLMVTKVRGKFAELSGTLTIAENPAESSAEITLQAASITTESADRDGHLKSADFLDVDNHKELTFRSTAVNLTGSTGTIAGDLTIKGITKPVTLDFEYLGTISDPWGNPKAAFSAEAEIDREDWGLTWNVPLDTGGVLVSKKVKLEIEAQAQPAPAA